MIEEIVEQIKQSTDYQINKRILREKIQGDLHFAYNGGLFKSSPELIAFLQCWDDNELVIEDTYQTPVKINRVELLTLCKQHYQTALNFWHVQHEELKRVRKI